MLNVKNLIKKALLMIILTCGLSNSLKAIDLGAWNPRNLATRFSYWYSGLLSPYAVPTPEEIGKYEQAQEQRLMKEKVKEKVKETKTREEMLQKIDQMQARLEQERIVEQERLELLNNNLKVALERILENDDKENQWKEVKEYIEQGADVNTLYNNVTALYLAATEVPTNNEMVQFLLNRSAYQEAGNPSYNDYLETKTLLKQQRNKSPELTRKAYIQPSIVISPKQQKIENNNLAAQAEWLRFNDDLTQKDIDHGFYMIHKAINNGADTNYINQESEFKTPALNAAAKYMNENMVAFLLTHNANPSLTDKDGKTALQLSLENLLQHRDNKNLLNTIWNIVKHLISKGADVNTTTHNNLTALHIAVGEDNLVMINFLKIHGANVLAQDVLEVSPLGMVIQSKNPSMRNQVMRILYPEKYRL